MNGLRQAGVDVLLPLGPTALEGAKSRWPRNSDAPRIQARVANYLGGNQDNVARQMLLVEEVGLT